VVLNCTRLLTRILPYIFEDADWRGFFWSNVPGAGRAGVRWDLCVNALLVLVSFELLRMAVLLLWLSSTPLAESLLLALADLLFCPNFTVNSHRKDGPESAEDMQSMDSCEYIWEAGVGFAQSPPLNYHHDLNRTELLKLLLTCFSEAMYLAPSASDSKNPWVAHALPLFTSLLNVVCAYDPVGYGIPYNHLLFSDQRERLVEMAMQILVVTLEHEVAPTAGAAAAAALDTLEGPGSPYASEDHEPTGPDNLFVNYLSRIHREEDFGFILKGLGRLMNNPLAQTYLPHSTKKINFHQELLILFWKICDFNKVKFLFFVLKSSDVLDMLPYTVRVPMDVPVFSGSHADLLIVIFHKIITSGHQRLQPLYDCLLTIIVNVSPYLKSLSMVAANKLLHLLEAFSSTWFLFSSVQNHHLVFFLLEVFNNIIQYQFDGNFNLVYAIIRKRSIFHQLANLPTDTASIQRALQRRKNSPPAAAAARAASRATSPMEGSRPAAPTEPGTLKASLEATPAIDKLTEKSQVSVDGTMVALKQQTPTQKPAAPTAAAAAAVDVSDTESNTERDEVRSRLSSTSSPPAAWRATPDWVLLWKSKLPLQTIMRLLQVLVPQVEKICIDKGLTDESEILKFLQHGTLVGLLPVPHPILIRKYQANAGTTAWFRTYMWGVIYLRNVDPPVWYDTDVRLFEIQRI
ncbi:hypothetical protein CRUP_033267, partial [Coryphaenoides rupestris]